MSEAALRRAADDLIDWVRGTALPLWWTLGADRINGGFFEVVALDGATPARPQRARVQARQIYAYAATSALGPFPHRDQAVEHGLAFFLSRYRRADGLHRTVVAPGGAPLDETVWLYDQAFALFALAEAQRAAPGRTDLAPLAAETLQALEGMRLPSGGFREASTTDPFQSNPHMHLLEAALAWEEVGDDPRWGGLADEIAALALSRFVDPSGALHEFFDEDWGFAPGLQGRIVEPGHQFEWAWLLRRWGVLRGRPDALQAAARLFEIGLTHGVDTVRGVAFDQMLDDMSVHSATARLWPQTERIKAALTFWEGEADPVRKAELARETVRAIDGLKRYLDVRTPGLWRDKLGPDNVFVEEPAPASSFYHIVCAALELRRALRMPAAAAMPASPAP